MQSEQAGMATELPIMNFAEISHHTGAQLITFALQTMELMNWIRHDRPVQIM